ncbi:MAG: amidohydrolase family protein, partial [Sphingomonas sp.]
MDRRTLLGGIAAASVATPALAGKRPYRVISCEEAFSIPEIVEATRTQFGGKPSMKSGPIAGPFMPNLLDIGAGRIAGMDAAGVDVQILAVTAPGVQNFPPDQGVALAALANDRLAAAIKAHPTRFAGLTTLAPQAPAEAVKELERGVRTLGLKGGMINSHTGNLYLDDKRFWPILEAAEALDVPLYLHPRDPAEPMAAQVMVPGFNVGWGYGVETGTHVVRMIAAGVFDRFPKLRFAIGHGGETLPYILDRIDNRYQWESNLFSLSRLRKRPSDYIRENFVITTSGMNYPVPVHAAIEA